MEYPGFCTTRLETLRYRVSVGAGISLLPVLVSEPPIAAVPGLMLLHFCGDKSSRRC